MTANARIVLRHIAGDSPETFSDLYVAHVPAMTMTDLLTAISDLTEAGLIEQRYCVTDAGRKEAES